MRRVVVIGSNCFTGSHVVDGLLDDPQTEVVGVSRSAEYAPLFLPYKRRNRAPFRFFRIDLVREFPRLVRLLEEMRPAVVINVAALSEVALSFERPVEYFETNTLGVVRLCNYLRDAPWLERYVHVSSAEILGPCPTPMAEDAPFRPTTPYAASKAAADFYIDTARRQSRFPATIVRSTNVYGHHQQLWKIIPRAVIFLKQGRTIALHGGGRAIKSFVHVRDVVRGLLLAMAHPEPATYHLSVASEATVADVVRTVCDAMGHDFRRATTMVDERPGQDARYWLDCQKAERELGWSPAISMEAGIRETIAWVEEHWAAIRLLPHAYVHRV
jgi:dTDP-glucose 4,6-dehydratase